MHQELISALYETILMVFISGLLTLFIGLPLGAILNLTRPKKPFAKPKLNRILDAIMHFAQSLPYVVLMIALMPITSFFVNHEEGWLVAILPLCLACIPHFAHLCDEIFNTIPEDLIELIVFYGAKPIQIIVKVLLPETWQKLIQAFTKSLIQLLSYSAIAGLLGASGLGSLAIQKGYPNFQTKYVIATAIILIFLTQILQSIGNYFSKKSLS